MQQQGSLFFWLPVGFSNGKQQQGIRGLKESEGGTFIPPAPLLVRSQKCHSCSQAASLTWLPSLGFYGNSPLTFNMIIKEGPFSHHFRPSYKMIDTIASLGMLYHLLMVCFNLCTPFYIKLFPVTLFEPIYFL